MKETLNRVLLEITIADVPGILNTIKNTGIDIYYIAQKNDFEVQLFIQYRDLKRIQEIALRRGGRSRVISFGYIHRFLKAIYRRPILVFGAGFLIFLSLWMPNRIFFIKVDGNTNIPEKLIIERAAECGIRTGTLSKTVSSEEMKNKLLESMEGLKWAGINTYGCTAIISVKERTLSHSAEKENCVANIIATRDGIVDTITALRGNAVCVPGESVIAGQTLISGYTDCGFKIQAGQASGEVYAYTIRDLTVLLPSKTVKREDTLSENTRFYILIGKKRINLYKSSGILDASCVRMYSKFSISFPGGFVLPISICKETWTVNQLSEQELSLQESILRSFAKNYLKNQMIAGRIVSFSDEIQLRNACFSLTGKYHCHEMIGELRFEEYVDKYGKNS